MLDYFKLKSIDDLFGDETEPTLSPTKRKLATECETDNKRIKLDNENIKLYVKYYAKIFPYSAAYNLFKKGNIKREFAFNLVTKNEKFKMPTKFLRNIDFFSLKAMKNFFFV